MVNAYLQDSPFTAKQSTENEIAYERLMDVRLKLVELSYEIDKNHDSYMRFLTQTLNSPDLKNRIGKVQLVSFFFVNVKCKLMLHEDSSWFVLIYFDSCTFLLTHVDS